MLDVAVRYHAPQVRALAAASGRVESSMIAGLGPAYSIRMPFQSIQRSILRQSVQSVQSSPSNPSPPLIRRPIRKQSTNIVGPCVTAGWLPMILLIHRLPTSPLSYL